MRLGLAWCAGLLLATGCSCGGTVDPDGGLDGGAFDGSSVDAVVPPSDGASPDAVAPDGGVTECASAADCEAVFGPAPCGTWTCTAGSCDVECVGCTDGDGDGYGPEAACAGPDCDDSDDALGDNGVRSCYSGPAGTAGVGECLAGSEACIDGVLGPCTGSVVPSGEACNDQDDDCDASTDEALGDIRCGIGACAASAPACLGGGMLGACRPLTPAADDSSCDGADSDCDGAIDEDCAVCVRVSERTGDDTAAVADDNATPFATIQAGIDWAAMDVTRPRVVCVASGAGCAATRTYSEDVVMSDGISVRGRYEDSAFTSCGSATSGRTTIAPSAPEGVLFPSSVSSPTSLSNFDIVRASTPTTAAVTVDAATSVTLSRLFVVTTPSVMRSYGINLINGAEATVTQCSIYGGAASVESIGVRSVGSSPTIIDNCQTLDAAGRCDDFCGGGRNVGIRGSFSAATTGEAYGVLLEASPGARLEQSAVCGCNSDNGAGVRIRGDATGTLVRGNLINAWGGALDSHGVWMTDCGGATPWVLDNVWIAGAGDSLMTRVDGVRAVGDCHPVIDANVRITGGGEGGTTGANGVFCGADPSTGTPSACVVLGNLLIEGSAFGFPPTSVGVRCEAGSCLRIADNLIDARGGLETWGVWLDRTGTFVDDNEIRGGCATMRSVGVYAEDAYARLQNNRILGGTCPPTGAAGAAETVGLHVAVDATSNQLDVHSNTIDGQGLPRACQSVGVAIDDLSGGSAVGSGTYRNNILTAGVCATAYGFEERAGAADPRVFENNDLDPSGPPTAVYRDENATDLSDATMVDALTDMTVSGNISEDPMFVAAGDYHVAAGSMCANAGTAVGAPVLDMDEMTRDATPDIGADEL